MTRLLARRSHTRRLNRRILIAMLAVALLPVGALTALVGAELAAVNQSTVDEAHRTIVADAQQRESSAASDAATSIAAPLDSLGTDLGELADTLDPLLHTTSPTVQPAQRAAGGARLLGTGAGLTVTLVGSGSPLLKPDGTISDPMGPGRAQIATALDGLRKRHPTLTAVWLYGRANQELIESPVTDLASLTNFLQSDRIDPAHLVDRQLETALRTVGAGAPASAADPTHVSKTPLYPAWSDIDSASFSTGSSVTVWSGLTANPDFFVGAELSSAAIASLLPGSISTLPDAYPLLLSRSGRWLTATGTALTDFQLTTGFEGRPMAAPGLTAQQLTGPSPRVVDRTIAGVPREFFTAPVNTVHWTLATVVPTRELAPATASLGDGIRTGVRRILLFQLLPLAVLIGVIAVAFAAVFSRRLVGPVRALTTSAEHLAQGRMDEPVPRQGDDEVGLLSDALERMRVEINTSREALLSAARELEQRVAERTEELRDRNEELVALNALAATLTRSLDPAELLSGAVEAVRAILPVTAAAGYTMADDLPHLVTHHPARLGEAADDMAQGVAVALASGALSVRHSPAGRVVAIPVSAGGPALGAVAALVPASVQVPERLRILLGAVADQVGLGLRTAQFAAEGRELAVLEERTRLAREIHDTLAQQLTGIVLQLEAAEAMSTRDKRQQTRDLLIAAREQARLALQEARRSVWDLRPMPLETAGLTAAVALEAQRFGERTGMAVTVRNEGVPRDLALGPQAEVAVFRIMQEALANAGRHSRAGLVDVDLHAGGAQLVLTVRDNGLGFDTESEDSAGTRGGSFGLVGMRERARLIGAELEVVSDPAGGGTTVLLRVPLEPQRRAASA